MKKMVKKKKGLTKEEKQINKIKKETIKKDKQWMGLCSRSLFANLSFGTWKTSPGGCNALWQGSQTSPLHGFHLNWNWEVVLTHHHG